MFKLYFMIYKFTVIKHLCFHAQAAMAFTLAPKSAKVNKAPFFASENTFLGGRLRELGGDKKLPFYSIIFILIRPVQSRQFAVSFFL